MKAEVIQEMIAGKIGFSLWSAREREKETERKGGGGREEYTAAWVVMDSGSLNNAPIFTFTIFLHR